MYGVVVALFVAWFTRILLRITDASVGWGMGEEWVWIQQFMREGVADRAAGFPLLMAMVLISVVHVLAWGIVFGFIASYVISAMTIVYAVMRRSVDGTEMSEVFLPELEESALIAPPPSAEAAAEASPSEEPKPSE